MEEGSEERQLDLWFWLVDDTNEGGPEKCERLPNVHRRKQDRDDLEFFFFYYKHIYVQAASPRLDTTYGCMV